MTTTTAIAYSQVARANAEDTIDEILLRGAALAQALAEEQTAEDGRAAVKVAAIQRIMEAGPNSLTRKAHSASSAEAIVETDAEYAAYRRRQALLAVARQEACARYEAARLRARLAVALVEIETSGGQGA